MWTWYGVGAIAAIIVGWLAALVHASGHAPVGLISAGVGIALGAALGLLAASQRLAGSRQLIVGTLLLAVLTVLAEHAWLYLGFRRQWHESRDSSSEVAMFRDESPPAPRKYFEREFMPRRAALWVVDATIIIGASIGTVVVMQRKMQHMRVASDAAESLNSEP